MMPTTRSVGKKGVSAIEELETLTEEEFSRLADEDKWAILESLRKLVAELRVRSEKNCEECEKSFLTPEDVNIDLFFQDWRDCSERCDHCGKEEAVNMCQLQFELMNHIANALLDVQRKQNLLTQLVLRRDKNGSDLLRKFAAEKEAADKRRGRSSEMYR